MIALAAVSIYYVFGLDITAILSLVRFVVTAVIVVLTIRIPYKRKYH